jgi:hypothetical protein
MPKSVHIDFPLKSATELASRLRVSRARAKRILTMVDKAAKKSSPVHATVNTMAKARNGRVRVRAKRGVSAGLRTNATAAR